MVRTKVFVGNLSFEITEAELLNEFSAAGKVISANIITRGPRSLGYGFVEMDSEEDAQKAVDAMHKKDIKGRQINVEVAKPQDETKKPQPKPAQGENVDGAAPQRQQRSRRRPANKGPKSETTEEGKAPKPRNPRRAPAAEGESDEGAAAKKTRAPRPKPTGLPKRTPTEPREESKTTLFVANLPFSYNDEEFAKILSEKGLKLKSAHVVSKKNGKSKGYGFVEFDTQDDQQKALAALNKISVDNRELSVKVALTELKTQEEDKAAADKNVAAPSEKKSVANDKKTGSPAEKKAPAEKKVNAPAEKKSTPTNEKKTAAPEKKADTPVKTSTPAEKKTTPTVEKKASTPTTEKK